MNTTPPVLRHSRQATHHFRCEETQMDSDPYRIDPSRSPVVPNSGWRRSGLWLAAAIGAAFLAGVIVWSFADSGPDVTTTARQSAPASAMR
jgi:hypothetical protein